MTDEELLAALVTERFNAVWWRSEPVVVESFPVDSPAVVAERRRQLLADAKRGAPGMGRGTPAGGVLR